MQTQRRLYSFVVWETASEAGYEVFAADDFDQGLSEAREYVRSLSGAVLSYALVYDGYLSLEGRRHDAIFLEVGESGNSQSQLFAQEYAPRTLFRGSHPIGKLKYLEPVKSLFMNVDPARSTNIATWANH